MAWQEPKTDWKAADPVAESDFNRIEGNIGYLNEKAVKWEDIEDKPDPGFYFGTGEDTTTVIAGKSFKTIDINYPEGVECSKGGIVFLVDKIEKYAAGFHTGAISMSPKGTVMSIAIHYYLFACAEGIKERTVISFGNGPGVGSSTNYGEEGSYQFGDNIFLNYCYFLWDRLAIEFYNASNTNKTLNLQVYYVMS